MPPRRKEVKTLAKLGSGPVTRRRARQEDVPHPSPSPDEKAHSTTRPTRARQPRRRLRKPLHKIEETPVNQVADDKEASLPMESTSGEKPQPSTAVEPHHPSETLPSEPDVSVPYTSPIRVSNVDTAAFAVSTSPNQGFLPNEPEPMHAEGLQLDSEVAYRPDPLDPFGFLDAERKLKYRREALGPLNQNTNRPPTGREKPSNMTEKEIIEWSDEDGEDEGRPLAFATPEQGGRRTMVNEPLSSAKLVTAKPSRTTRSKEKKAEPLESRLTTAELEQLLPKRKSGSKRTLPKRSSKGKKNVTDENDYPQTKRPRVGRARPVKAEGSEGESIDIDDGGLQARRERLKLYEDLKDYKLETETVLWV
ncbi:hypothetical protein FRB99_002640 [Tulasnella sp. 403]|nr:hypothetical protein FRB99_002640 [Tulasnella sp. 403]